MTQLTSRVSEANPRVTIFEPSAGEGDERSLSTSKGNVGRFSDESDEVATTTRLRKRVKLETGTDLADLEDLAYSPQRSLRKARRTMVHEKVDEDEVEYESNTSLKRKKRSTTASPSKAKAKAKPVPQELETPHPTPPNWREVYDMIKAMRSQFVAPVDTMGCAQAQTGETDPRVGSQPSL
jgi:endonuclease-3